MPNDIALPAYTNDRPTNTGSGGFVPRFGMYDVPSGGGGGGGCCPIAVDFNNNGFAFQNADDSGVFAEVNSDGWKHAIAWPVNDQLMALDADGRLYAENGGAGLCLKVYRPRMPGRVDSYQTKPANEPAYRAAA